jgi:hypothetical protein
LILKKFRIQTGKSEEPKKKPEPVKTSKKPQKNPLKE